jgi:hypothetical protein
MASRKKKTNGDKKPVGAIAETNISVNDRYL